MTQKVSVTVRARLTPITVGPDDVLLLEFLQQTNQEIMDAAVQGMIGALRRAGRHNEIVAVPSWVKVKNIKKSKPRSVNGRIRPAVAKRRALA